MVEHRLHSGGPRRVGIHLGQRTRRVSDAPQHRFLRCVGREGEPPGEHPEGHERERVYVAPAVHIARRELLGAHVLGCADHEAGLRDLLAFVVERFRDAEVHDLRFVLSAAPATNHDVVGLQIAMHDSQFVRGAQRLRYLRSDLRRARGIERTLALDDLRQRLAIDVLHGEVQQTVGRLAEVDDARHVTVLDAARARGLLVEARERSRVAHQRGVEDLDGPALWETDVFGEIHASHPALAELLRDQVAIGDDGVNEVVAVG